MPEIDLDTPLAEIPSVGVRRARLLDSAGLLTIEDLLWRLPFRHEDRSQVVEVNALTPGVPATLLVEVVSYRSVSTRRRGFSMAEAQFKDRTGVLKAVFFNQAYLQDWLLPGVSVYLFGGIENASLFPEMKNPEVERATTGAAIHAGRVVPVYERIGSIGPRAYRSMLHGTLNLTLSIPEILPREVVHGESLVSRREAFIDVHFPSNGDRFEAGRRRLAFEELFIEQLGVLSARGRVERERGARPLPVDDALKRRLGDLLPFPLTAAQKRVLREIVQDLGRDVPMRRLVQGDVGCGKTVVAALAMAIASANGGQAAIMAPTELLAEQHVSSLERLLGPLNCPMAILTASMSASRRREILHGLASGEIAVVVGTQALIQSNVRFRSLSLIVIDEQHRFGVIQREALASKGDRPHLLVMTATPIPRSLALTVYGDLDMSLIDELPPGRQAVRTVLRISKSEARTYDYLRSELDKGRQGYVVCPLVEGTEDSDLTAADEWATTLERGYLKGYRVGLVHGRLAALQRREVMANFASGEIQVLVGTTVVEVGVDVANASVLIIEHAERFGLSQLHQLRGRIGRGHHESTCFLMIRSRVTAIARKRLEVVRASNDGFAIADADLTLRGPGDLFGTRQWGLPAFRAASVVRDQRLIERARVHVTALVARPGWIGTAEAKTLLSRFARRGKVPAAGS